MIFMLNMKKFRVKFLFSLIFLIFLNNSAFSQNLSISGLDRISKSDLIEITSIDIEKNYLELDEINKLIKDLYSSDLIYDIEYELINDTHNIKIFENKVIEKIFINGNVRIKEDIFLENISSSKKLFLDKKNISNDIKIIKDTYSSIGYKDANVNVQIEKFSKDRVNLIFQVNEGKISELINIDFKGNANFSDKFLSSLITSKSYKFYNIFSSGSNFEDSIFNFDKDKLLNFYRMKGFFDIDISYILSEQFQSKYILTFYVNEGKRYKIKNYYYENDEIVQSIPDYLERSFQKELTKNNYYFDNEVIFDHLESLNEFLFDRRLVTNSLNYKYDIYQNNEIDLFFYKENFAPKYINKIEITGNTITKENTIRNKLDFEPGDLFIPSSILSTKNKLSQLKYINSVDILENDLSEQKTDIEIKLDENKKTGTFLFGGSVSGDVGLGIGISLKDYNLLGTGNEIDTTFNINSEQALFKLDYSTSPSKYPSITNTYSLYNEENDLTPSFGYKTKKYGLGYFANFDFNEEITISSGLRYEDTEGYSAKNNNAYITDSIGQFQNYSFQFSITQNSTNNFLYPSDGSYNRFYIQYSPKEISDDSFYKIVYNNDFYLKRKNKNSFFFFDNNIGIAKSLNGKLKTINSFSLGGLNFKGFDYRGIGPFSDNIYLGGNNYFTSTVGYGSSFLFDEKDNINLKLFYTTGSIWDSDYATDNDIKIRSSTGISFDVLTAIGPLSFSYAVPIDTELNDKKRSFNFSIGSSF